MRTQDSTNNSDTVMKTIEIENYSMTFEVPREWKERYGLDNSNTTDGKLSYEFGVTKSGVGEDNMNVLFSITNYPRLITYTIGEGSDNDSSKWQTVTIGGKEFDVEYYERSEGGTRSGNGAGNYLVKLEDDLFVSAEFFSTWKFDCRTNANLTEEFGCEESDRINYTESGSSDSDLEESFKSIKSIKWEKTQ